MSPSSRSLLRRSTRPEEHHPQNPQNQQNQQPQRSHGPSSSAEAVSSASASSQEIDSTEPEPASNADSASMQRQQIVGYYNHFHSRARVARDDGAPPTYAAAVAASRQYRFAVSIRPEEGCEQLPAYTCTVAAQGVLGLKPELSSPFQHAPDRHWRDVYVVLRGTQLSIHKLKSSALLSKGKPQQPRPGRLINSYTLQHAEVGIAADFKKVGPVPRSAFVRLCSSASRQKLYESDPHMFEPPREYALRLRVEGEQFLLSCPSLEDQLDWTEALCMAVDISMPLDERAEPRYRSLPRRGRRRQAIVIELDNLGNMAIGRRLVEEQERILRTLYPNLAGSMVQASNSEREPTTAQEEEREQVPDAHGDPEAEDLDPSDVMIFPPSTQSNRDSHRPATAHGSPAANPHLTADSCPARPLTSSSSRPAVRSSIDGSRPKPAAVARQIDPATLLRFRRRCAPSLLACSPRTSDVLFIDGKRWKVHPETQTLRAWELGPPRYTDHGFPTAGPKTSSRRAATTTPAPSAPTTAATAVADRPTRPGAMVRALSSLSAASADSSSSRSAHDAAASDLAVHTHTQPHATAAPRLSPETSTAAKRISSESSMRAASPARGDVDSGIDVRPVTPTKAVSDALASKLSAGARKKRSTTFNRGREGAPRDGGRFRDLVRLF